MNELNNSSGTGTVHGCRGDVKPVFILSVLLVICVVIIVILARRGPADTAVTIPTDQPPTIVTQPPITEPPPPDDPPPPPQDVTTDEPRPDAVTGNWKIGEQAVTLEELDGGGLKVSADLSTLKATGMNGAVLEWRFPEGVRRDDTLFFVIEGVDPRDPRDDLNHVEIWYTLKITDAGELVGTRKTTTLESVTPGVNGGFTSTSGGTMPIPVQGRRIED